MAYAQIRAAVLAFTYDESWSFNGFAKGEVLDVLFNTYPVANNHVLHSLAMKLFWLLFGQNEYALRLPVLLSHLGFVLISYKLFTKYLPQLALGAFVFLNFQPYLLDYFVAARGYGLALVFTIYAVFLLFKFVEKQRINSLVWSVMLSLLAAWSNFTYLLISVTVVFVSTVLMLNSKPSLWKSFGLKTILVLVIFVPFIYIPLKELSLANELYYGGNSGFFQDTVYTLSQQMLYGLTSNSFLITLYPVISILSLFTSIILGFKKWKKEKSVSIKLWLSSSLLLLPAVGTVLLHHLFNKPYLIDRTALFLLPLSIIQLVFLIDSIKTDLSVVKVSFSNSFGLVTLILFSLSANFNYLVDFKEHSDTRTALLDLQKIHVGEEQSSTVFTLGKSTYMNSTINFYKSKYDLNFMTGADLRFCNEKGPYPYYYLFGGDRDCLEGLPVELVKHYPVSETYLYKHKSQLKE